jgi:hypothetical protein
MIIYVNIKFNSSEKNLEELVYGWFFIIFHRFLIDFAQSFIWLSLDNSKDISRYSSLPNNYLLSLKLSHSFPNNYFLYL